MNKSILSTAVAVLALSFSAAAQDNATVQFKPYGFIRNYFAADSRESVYGVDDLFYYLPKDRNIVDGEDLNAQSTYVYGNLTSRLGLDIVGYQVNGWNVSARFEADFAAGLSGVTGTATLRLRQAFVTLAKDGVSIKAGQSWHPMAADMPHIFSLNTGAPFGPFSRTPEVVADFGLGNGVTLTTAALWQMQYTSAGPSGASAEYIKYGGIPELYAGLNYKQGGFTLRAGLDMLSIKPRHLNTAGTRKVKDRITTVSPFFYAEYVNGMFAIKAKTIFAQAGEHVNLNGGYGVSSVDSDGTWHYAPTRNSSSWISFTYGKKVQAVLFGGYVHNFGTARELVGPLYFSKNSFSNMTRMFRITPELMFNWGKVTLGLEYELTGVQYGTFSSNDRYGLATHDLRWVCNNRILAMLRYSF
ncbi:MAG: hypothetical protein IKO29_07435 [Bacteroidales bacterium]|nr:hypothetical protein [Bacteroidales bacterium]